MSQVPPQSATPAKPARYVILDTPDFTPLGQLLRLMHEPDKVTATLVLRDKQSGELSSVTIVRITAIEHEPERGAVFFGGTLADGRRIEAYVFATPQTGNEDVLGSASITE